MTGRRNVLKGASGLALGSLGSEWTHGGDQRCSAPRPWPRMPPLPPRRGGRQPAEHPLHHGRRHRLDERRCLPPRHHGEDQPQPGAARQRGGDLQRLLRRGELHGRPRQLHHRPAPHPHRPDHGRPGGRGRRHARRVAHAGHRPQEPGLRHRAVRQEPPGRPQQVPADRARLRRVLRLPLPPRRHGGPVLARLPAGSRWPPSVRATSSTPSPATPTIETEDPRWGKVGKQTITDEGPLPPHPMDGIKYNMETFDEVIRDSHQRLHRAGGQPGQALLRLDEPDPHAHLHPPLARVPGDAELGEHLGPSKKRA